MSRLWDSTPPGAPFLRGGTSSRKYMRRVLWYVWKAGVWKHTINNWQANVQRPGVLCIHGWRIRWPADQWANPSTHRGVAEVWYRSAFGAQCESLAGSNPVTPTNLKINTEDIAVESTAWVMVYPNWCPTILVNSKGVNQDTLKSVYIISYEEHKEKLLDETSQVLFRWSDPALDLTFNSHS